uniref:Coiled-coil domain-containing protein 96 n=1 Tax=Hydra vulgaris TaxID=6087 RepID=T2MC62_HYDVU
MSENILHKNDSSNEELKVLVNTVEPVTDVNLVTDQTDILLTSELSNNVLDTLSQSSYLSNKSLTPEKNDSIMLEDRENNHDHEGFEEIKNLQNEDNVNEKVIAPEVVSSYDRESLIKEYKEISEERIKLQKVNNQYQHKLAEYFQKKKTEEQIVDIERNENDQEQRYQKYISNLKELQSEEARQATNIQAQIEECKARWEGKLKEVDEVSKVFNDLKYNIGKNAISSHSGKKIASTDLEIYRLAEIKKEQEVIACRLENIKLKNQLKKYEMQLREKEELGEGLHLIDFEQLKIENQTFNEKIEDRNEELMKLRKKITTTVQIFSHVKEKLQFIQDENIELRQKLQDLDVTLAQRRDILTRNKQIRDSLRTDNNKLKHQAGLLGNETLLLDFEQCVDKSEQLRSHLTQLKDQHKELSICLKTLRKNIEF